MAEPGIDVTFKDYVDARLTEVQRAVDLALAAQPDGAVPLREHVDTVFAEREKAFMALVEANRLQAIADIQSTISLCAERRAGLNEALKALNGRIDDGDQRLRDHVSAQVGQIQSALDAAQREASARDSTLEHLIESVNTQAAERLAGMQREAQIATDAASVAIAKAEHATDRRLEAVQLAIDTRLAALQTRMQELAQKVDKIT